MDAWGDCGVGSKGGLAASARCGVRSDAPAAAGALASPLSIELVAAFRLTDFVVGGERPIELRVDHPAPGLPRWLTEQGARAAVVTEQVLAGGAEQIGELEVLVAQAVDAEVRDQLAQLDVGDLAALKGA